MGDYNLDRRRMLSGSIACVGLMHPRPMTAAPSTAEPPATGIKDVETRDKLRHYIMRLECPEQRTLCHAPFQAEFLAWLTDAAARFALPVFTDDQPTATAFLAHGLNPALMINLHGCSTINVSVLYNERNHTFNSMHVNAQETANGAGWHNTVFLPQARRIHATREACWREDCFEIFLDWFNNDLVPTTHVALYGEDEEDGSRWSIVRLLRDGRDTRTGRPVSAGFLRALLPLRVPASAIETSG